MRYLLAFLMVLPFAAAAQTPLPTPKAYAAKDVGDKVQIIMELLEMLQARDAEIVKLKAELDKFKMPNKSDNR